MIQQKKKEKREEQILLRLNDVNFATRKQLQIMEILGGDRNAHRILHRMEKDRIISSVRREKKIYYLSNRGKEQIGSNQSSLKRNKINHTLMANDLYIHLGMPNTWKRESKATFNDEVIISDAMYINHGKYVFVEIDNVQTMRTNIDKIKKYERLFNIIYNQQKIKPTLIWYTLSDVRKEKLSAACRKSNIEYKVY